MPSEAEINNLMTCINHLRYAFRDEYRFNHGHEEYEYLQLGGVCPSDIK